VGRVGGGHTPRRTFHGVQPRSFFGIGVGLILLHPGSTVYRCAVPRTQIDLDSSGAVFIHYVVNPPFIPYPRQPSPTVFGASGSRDSPTRLHICRVRGGGTALLLLCSALLCSALLQGKSYRAHDASVVAACTSWIEVPSSPPPDPPPWSSRDGVRSVRRSLQDLISSLIFSEV